MPTVRNAHATFVQGRDQRAQAASSLPAHERGDGEGERDGKADIARVEQWRMHDQSEVLKQRVQVRALGRHPGQQALEGAAGAQQEQQETEIQQAHRAQYAPEDLVRQPPASDAHRPGPHAHDQRPQEKRALVRAPGRADPVVPGQQAVGILRHVGDGEVAHDKGPDKHREADSEQQRADTRRALPTRLRQVPLTALTWPTTPSAKGHHQGRDNGEVSDFDDHGSAAPDSGVLRIRRLPHSAIPASSGGM